MSQNTEKNNDFRAFGSAAFSASNLKKWLNLDVDTMLDLLVREGPA